MGTPSTFGNASGLQQIPGGSKTIPQSFLNQIGREIDRARQTPNIGQVAIQTPGGSNIDIAAAVAQYASAFLGRQLPFEVNLVKVNGSSLQVTIAEGRIFGRADWGSWSGAFADYVNIGASGFNPTYAGPWSDAGATAPEPVENPKSKDVVSKTGKGTFNAAQQSGGSSTSSGSGIGKGGWQGGGKGGWLGGGKGGWLGGGKGGWQGGGRGGWQTGGKGGWQTGGKGGWQNGGQGGWQTGGFGTPTNTVSGSSGTFTNTRPSTNSGNTTGNGVYNTPSTTFQ